MAGAAFWRLGGEDPAVWDAVRNRWGSSTPPRDRNLAHDGAGNRSAASSAVSAVAR